MTEDSSLIIQTHSTWNPAVLPLVQSSSQGSQTLLVPTAIVNYRRGRIIVSLTHLHSCDECDPHRDRSQPSTLCRRRRGTEEAPLIYMPACLLYSRRGSSSRILRQKREFQRHEPCGRGTGQTHRWAYRRLRLQVPIQLPRVHRWRESLDTTQYRANIKILI